MKLYDDLYIGIPSGIRIEGCVIGEKWTTVRANGNIGLARTLERAEYPEKLAASFIGAFLRDTANHMKWENLTLASVGVAAMNAWYNTKERASGLDGNATAQDLCGKVAYVGDYTGENVFPMPGSRDFDISAYLPLKNFDAVVISADALITGALPKLLDSVGGRGNVVLDGYSLPCTALFFAFDMPVRELRGFYPIFAETLEAYAKEGKSDPAPGVEPFIVTLNR